MPQGNYNKDPGSQNKKHKWNKRKVGEKSVTKNNTKPDQGIRAEEAQTVKGKVYWQRVQVSLQVHCSPAGENHNPHFGFLWKSYKEGTSTGIVFSHSHPLAYCFFAIHIPRAQLLSQLESLTVLKQELGALRTEQASRDTSGVATDP